MENNIILIGMPGCGKSTCGVLAAKALCKSFADTDLLLQEREKMPLQSIINIRGPEYFARAERDCLLSLDLANTVISTGGSAVYYGDAMLRLRQGGRVIYLRISLEEMLRRVGNMTTRGILLREGESIEDMFAERQPLYERCADSRLGRLIAQRELPILRRAMEEIKNFPLA